MSERLVISHRAGFGDALSEARTRTVALAGRSGGWDVPTRIEKVLEYMTRATADGRVPTAGERERMGLGVFAARELSSIDPALCGLLSDLAYAFRRYDRLAFRPAARGILQVEHGRGAFQKFRLELGARHLLGAGDEADLRVSAKTGVRPRHVGLQWDGMTLRVRSLVDEPVNLDGESAWMGELPHGGLLQVGEIIFRFFVEGEGWSALRPSPPSSASKAFDHLASLRSSEQLFGVFDAARDRQVLEALRSAVDEHASLYEGPEGRALDDHAPYLVRFVPDSGLLERLLTAGWGKAWGIYIASTEPTKMVRRSLRRLLMVDAEGSSDRLYFRFYDPRVMTRFAPLATPRQRSEMLQASSAWIYEDDEGALTRFEEGAA